VYAVACTTVNGRPTAVTGSDDGTVRVWDLTSGEPIGQPFTGHTKPVRSVACTTVHGRPTAVIADVDGTAWVWDPVAGAGTVLTVGLEVTAVSAAPDGALVLGCSTEVLVMDQETGCSA
jgi:WD40 repeat protein